MANKYGRPPVLDETKCEVAIALVAVGCSLSTVARYLGVHRETLRRNAVRHPEFGKRLAQAAASLEWSHLRKVTQASGRSWRASAWMLERINPQRFGRRKADSISRSELNDVLDILTRILTEEINDPQARQQVLLRLQELHSHIESLS